MGGSGTYEQHLPSTLTRKDLRDCQSRPEQQMLRWWGHHWCKATCVLSYLLFPQLCGEMSRCPEIQLLRRIQRQNNYESPAQIFFTFLFFFFFFATGSKTNNNNNKNYSIPYLLNSSSLSTLLFLGMVRGWSAPWKNWPQHTDIPLTAMLLSRPTFLCLLSTSPNGQMVLCWAQSPISLFTNVFIWPLCGTILTDGT